MLLASMQAGLKTLGLTAEDFQSEDQIITLSYTPTRRAVINTINEIEFGAYFEARVQKQVGETSVEVVPLDHLRINKSNLWTVTGLGRT
jgi:hypothetical protein